jgi:photosystem II stability/assembly factor-like uncharacterized protein
LTTRISGRTRQETAVAVAEYGDTFTDLLREDALITRPDDFADALAAGALAGARRAAILLADGGGLDDATRSWLHDACPALHRVTAVGGKAVVDDTVLASAQEVGDCHVEVTGVCLTSGAGPAEEREGSPDRLADILFVTDRQGYVVGDGGIYATTDAGATWQLQLEIDAQLRHVNFIDASHGWAVGEDRILATDDGGVCWRDLPMPDPTLEEVQFHSPMDGIGVAQEPEDFDEPPPTVTLLRTNDGGQTWAPVDAPGPVRSACFTDDDRGWALLARGTEPQEARAVRTNDGGASWVFLLSVDSTGNDVDLQCASHQVAWLLLYGGAAGGSRTYEGYRLSDADGAQQVTCYRFQSSCASSGLGGSYPGPLSSVGPENAVFLTYTPSFDADNVSFRILTAASATDRSAPIPRMRSPSAAAFRSTELGWVVGSGDAGQEIVRTTDGGASWTSQLVIPRQQ